MSDIWLIGAGDMAFQYAKVLKGLKKEFEVIGRGDESAQEFESKIDCKVIRGGVEKYIEKADALPKYAIVVVYPKLLKDVTIALLNAGIKKILVEKPAGMDYQEVEIIRECAEKSSSDVYVAYNRRFYASTIAAKKIIDEDGGVESFNFEFTEWGHVIGQYDFPKEELEKWFMANSTHVVDLAFYLGGIPQKISCYKAGSLSWHSEASRYSGAGVTFNNALFSYKANWNSAGRWSVEILTSKRKILLEPLETLKIQTKGSVVVNPVEIDDSIDQEYKPGLYLQTKSFLEDDVENMIDIDMHSKMTKIYTLMETNGSYVSNGNWNSFQVVK